MAPEHIGPIVQRGLTDLQKAMRAGRITASVLPSIVGVSPWEGPLGAWLRITGRHDGGGNARTRAGHRFEPALLAAAAEDDGAELWTPGTLVHPTLPWLAATPDAARAPRPSLEVLYEAKLVGMRVASHWDDGVPEYVAVQTACQMAVSSAREVHVPALVGSTDYRHHVVYRDLEVESLLLEVAEKFYREHVQTDVAPAYDGKTTARELERLFGRGNGALVPAPVEAAELVARYQSASEKAKRAEAEKDAAKAALVSLIGDADGLEGDDFRVTWKWRDEVAVPATTRTGHRHFDCRMKRRRARGEAA